MHFSPAKLFEIGMVAVGAIGLLILIAPTFGRKPRPTADGWQFPVKLTCLLLYWLGAAGAIGAIAFGAWQLLDFGISGWRGWAGFTFGFVFFLLVLTDWPEPLVLDRNGLGERGSASSRIRWEDLRDICEYRVRYDRGLVIHSVHGTQLVVADIAYDSGALLACLLECRPVPFYALDDDLTAPSILGDTKTRI